MSKSQDTWYKERKSLFIPNTLHEKLSKVQQLYRDERHCNVPIGYIIEQLIEQDTYFLSLFNRVNN